MSSQQASDLMESTSLSDILAKDAARSYVLLMAYLAIRCLTVDHRSYHASETLAPLGFAPDETIADFYDMGANPEQFSHANFDFDMGTDAEQRVYYELLMGRSFDQPSQQI
jgi:hypothetical protein